MHVEGETRPGGDGVQAEAWVDVRASRGRSLGGAIRAIGMAEATCHRGRSKSGRLKLDHVRRLKEQRLENGRLRKAGSDLTLDKLILADGLSGQQSAPRAADKMSIRFARSLAWPSGAPSGHRPAAFGAAPDSARAHHEGRLTAAISELAPIHRRYGPFPSPRSCGHPVGG